MTSPYIYTTPQLNSYYNKTKHYASSYLLKIPSMVSPNNAGGDVGVVHSHKLSTVVPASVTGETAVHELSNVDLAMKLHYFRGAYYFEASDFVKGLGITNIKEPMFQLLDAYSPVAGRIRRTAGGRPFIKCSDSGLRIVEAKCDKTMAEWLAETDGTMSRERQMAADKILGPDLPFSPSAYLQFTRFKCGGMAIGFSWAHVLGDVVSATNLINQWGQILGGTPPPKSRSLHNAQAEAKKPAHHTHTTAKPLSVKEVEPVGDCWLTPNTCKMETFSYYIPETKLKELQYGKNQLLPFETLSAIIWQSLAKIRAEREPRVVTICRSASSAERSRILGNEHTISTVKFDASPAHAELSELAKLIAEQAVDEKKSIAELVDKDSGKPDLVLYGTNLTFVNLEEVDCYAMELKGQKPVHVDCSIAGVDDEGAVLVLPDPAKGGRKVTVILPENEILRLKELLEIKFGIA